MTAPDSGHPTERHAQTPAGRPSVTDAVFRTLYRRILSLDLPPGTRMSETELAAMMDVSRQPVRDAFYRLSKLGLLTIRPQRPTVVSAISERAVRQARFIRAAIETETVRKACQHCGAGDALALEAILDLQDAAAGLGDSMTFHLLDDQFHHEICARGGVGFAWEIICDIKGNMDRVRFLTLPFAVPETQGDHRAILAAIRARDPDGAAAAMQRHLGRIEQQIGRVRAEHGAYFTDD